MGTIQRCLLAFGLLALCATSGWLLLAGLPSDPTLAAFLARHGRALAHWAGWACALALTAALCERRRAQ
jgi:hypothetical protein